MKSDVWSQLGIDVGPLGLGCWAIGGPFWDQGGWMGYGDVDDAESVRAIHRALDLGVTFFDTGGVYGCGRSERILGRALAGCRQSVVIADKFGYVFDEANRRVTGRDATPAGIRRACEASLARLGRDVIDLYQFHLYDYPLEQAAEVRDVLEDLVTAGLIRSYAWCTEDLPRVRLFAEGKHCAVVPQLLNVLESNPDLLTLCKELNLGVIARRPLGMGLLTGKFSADAKFPDNDMRTRFHWNFRDGKQARQLERLEALRNVLQQAGRTLAQAALGYIWARSPGAVPIPGFKTVAQVEENVGATKFGPLDAGQLSEVERLLDR